MKKNRHAGTSIFAAIYKNKTYYLLLLPFLAFIIIFKYFPMYGVTLAFKDYQIRSGILGSPWAGFKYFEQLFNSYSFWEVLQNTIIISLSNLLFGFPVPIILAIFINEIRRERVKRVFQTVSYLPHFISWVIAASLLTDILALKGPINTLIQFFGGTPTMFMADTAWFRPIVILSNIWKICGWNSIIYIAAITGIDQELYEAAGMDGARKIQKIWYITLPCIKSTILTLFILEVGKIMSAGFDQIFNLYSPAVYSVGDVLDTYTYRQGIEDANYSYSTAAGLFQNAIGFILVVVSNVMTKKLSDGEGGLW